MLKEKQKSAYKSPGDARRKRGSAMKSTTYEYKKGKKALAAAIHATSDDGKHQAVGINLRVLILPDGKFWFAQGLEVDYGAQGDTIEQAKEHFEQGLAGTVRLHIQKHGHIEKLLRGASAESWKEARTNNANIERFMQVSFHDIIEDDNASLFPYPQVEYYRPRAVAA